jgi:hypothetical protein
MSWDVGKHRLGDELLYETVKMVKETQQDGRERHLDMCHSDGGLRLLKAGAKCVGEVCSVGSPVNICWDTPVGDIHTHPTADSTPSAGDLLNIISNTHNKGSHLGCRTGKPFKASTLECQYSTSLSRDELRKLYGTNNAIYMRDLFPFYEEWRRTGRQPAMKALACAAQDQIQDNIMPLLKTEKYTLDMEPKPEPAWITPPPKLPSPEPEYKLVRSAYWGRVTPKPKPRPEITSSDPDIQKQIEEIKRSVAEIYRYKR